MYSCKLCDYYSSFSKSFISHTKSIKHQTNEYLSSLAKEEKKSKKTSFSCKICNKTYNHGSSLSRHYKECSINNNRSL